MKLRICYDGMDLHTITKVESLSVHVNFSVSTIGYIYLWWAIVSVFSATVIPVLTLPNIKIIPMIFPWFVCACVCTSVQTAAWSWSQRHWKRRVSSRWPWWSDSSLPASPAGSWSSCCLCMVHSSDRGHTLQYTHGLYTLRSWINSHECFHIWFSLCCVCDCMAYHF